MFTLPPTGQCVPSVRAVSLTNYAEVGRFLGLDVDAMLREADIDRALLADPDHRLPAHAVVALFARSAALSGCQGFGLLMAECRTLASMGPASLALKYQADMRAMIETSIRVQRHFSDVVNMRLDDDGDTATLRWDFAPAFADRQWIEYSIAIGYRVFSELTEGRWQPETMHFTCVAPDDDSAYRRFFQCGLAFDADFNGLSCPSASLDGGNPAANATLAGHAERLLDLVHTGEPRQALVDRVRHAIYLLIHSGKASLDGVADNLGLHPRALQRQLEKDGWSFATLLNETRRELVLRYLATPHHSLATIARLAGYSDQSAFTRWFSAEFGETPAARRGRVAA